MFDQLKNLAIQQLGQRMISNALNPQSTEQAAQQGGNILMDLVKNQIAKGGIAQVQDLFSKGGGSVQQNGIFQQFQGQFQNILQNNGMNAEEAQKEAASTAPGLIEMVRDRFDSKDEKDSAFDLGQITNLIPGGDAGGMLNTIKKLF